MIIRFLDGFSPAAIADASIMDLAVITGGPSVQDMARYNAIYRGLIANRSASSILIQRASKRDFAVTDTVHTINSTSLQSLGDYVTPFLRIKWSGTKSGTEAASLWVQFPFMMSQLVVLAAHADTGLTVGDDLLRQPGYVTLG